MADEQQLAAVALPVSLSMARRAPFAGAPDALAVRRTAAGARRLAVASPRRPKGNEAQQVVVLLLEKLVHDVPGEDDVAEETLAVRSAFLRHRFTGPLTAYELGDRFYSYLDTTLNLTSVAAGIGASLLAASGSPKGWTIVLGVAIAACQTFSQWLKPSKRAARRGRAASELRNEAWDLLQGRDRYRDKDPNRAWDVFCDRVDRIEERQQAIEDSEDRSGATVSLGGRGKIGGR